MRLKKLGKLKHIYVAPVKEPPLPAVPRLTAPAEIPFAQQPVPPPFGSHVDWWGHLWFTKRDPYWLAQYQIGNTRPDEYHPLRRIAVYFDGAYFHDPKTAQDTYLRLGLVSKGMTVVAWRFFTLEEFQAHIKEWFFRDIGA